MIFVVKSNGTTERYHPNERLLYKVGQEVQITFEFYKDRALATAWDLSSAIKDFFAKKNKSSIVYNIWKGQTNTNWDVSDASSGILRLTLTATDLSEEASLYCEIKFQIGDNIYKTRDFILEVTKSVD